ncbi:MAG TPA: DNA polymerase III subunit delta' [Actinomycetes bacterium]|nr:DNA polymerase III subunit delta' [Actinomycetes bacterium]
MSATVWDQVVGHDEAVRTLRDALDTATVTHAWLFTGPPGVGKLHVAKVFAAALNCENARDSAADGTCPACRRVLRGVHPDVHLVQPEGDNLLVEEVRSVREEAWRSRQQGRTAVFILDEADRLTDVAANALLKVLEEPPPAVVFVLVARSAAALVGTVPSRARTVSFSDLSRAVLADGLVGELGVEREQAEWAAAAGHGRTGRARQLLVDEAARARRERVLDLTDRLSNGQPSDALTAATELVAVADDAMNAAKARQGEELAEYEQTFGGGRGSATVRRRMEARHRRELRRIRFEAIREAVADLLATYRDALHQQTGGDPAQLVHRDRAEAAGRLAARADAPALVQAAAALEEADRRLWIGAAPLLTCESAFLTVQGAVSGTRLPMARMDLRR